MFYFPHCSDLVGDHVHATVAEARAHEEVLALREAEDADFEAAARAEEAYERHLEVDEAARWEVEQEDAAWNSLFAVAA